MHEVVLMYLDELLIPENLYFDTNFMKLSCLEPKLLALIDADGHFGGHLEFDLFPYQLGAGTFSMSFRGVN